MSTDKVRIEAEVSTEVHDALRQIAIQNKRTLRRQVEWLLERHVQAQQEDGA